MKNTRQEAVLEAVLFSMGESVEVAKLADVIGETPERTREILEGMQKKWEKENRGVALIALEDCFQMCTRGEYYEDLIKIAKAPHKFTLSETLLETLSIVAYKQPVTKLDIEKIRGVNSDRAISKLVELDLLMELGRMDAPGRPLLFGTTEQFLRCFGVNSISDLPEMNAAKVEEFKIQAEQEVELQLHV